MEDLVVTYGGVPVRPKRKLAHYRAVVRLTLEYSSFELDPNTDEKLIRTHVEGRPQLQRPYKWPPKLTGQWAKDLEILALAKTKLVFDLGATIIPDLRPQEMRSAAYQRFLKTDPGRISQENAEAYARILVDAGVDEEGTVFWERYVESNNPLPPGLTGESPPGYPDDSDIELFAKTLMRADILERMERLRA